MGLIPDSIKQLKRPDKTEVRRFNQKYYVVPYISVWNKEKGKPMKKSLPYIGTLEKIDGHYQYVERKSLSLKDEPEVKEYANYKFIDLLNRDLYHELVQYYGTKDGTKIYVYAILRLLYGDTNSTLDEEYLHSYISIEYPNVAISKNTILAFIKQLGMHDNTNKKFLESRINQDYRVLIFDGTQMTNEGKNGLAEYGRQAKKTQKTQVCEIKVYDTVRKEPIYYETIPGNVIDKTAFIQVLNLFDVRKAIIIIDKGFNTKENVDYMLENQIQFIVPLNDNSKDLKHHLNHQKYTHTFKWNDRSIKCFKVELDNRFLYVYRDPFIAAHQESNYMNHISNDKNGYSVNRLDQKMNHFGVIGFYSNLDESPEVPYIHYKERWTIETYVKLEKTSLDNEVVRLHSTIGIYGVRFLVQIEMIMLSRVYNKLKDLEILKTSSVIQTMKRLSKTYKIFRNGKWKTSITTKKNIKFLNDLNIPIA